MTTITRVKNSDGTTSYKNSATGTVGRTAGEAQTGKTTSGYSESSRNSLTPVITSKNAALDLQNKQLDFATMQANNATHAANLAQQKAQQDQIAAESNRLMREYDLKQKEQDLKGKEIAGKNAALGVVEQKPLITNTYQPVAQTVSTPPQQTTSLGRVSLDNQGISNAPVSKQVANTNDAMAQTTSDYTSASQDIQDTRDSLSNSINRQLSQVLKGTFPLTKPQQSMITSLQNQLEENKQKQEITNKGYVQSVAQAGFRSGGEYTPEQYAGQIANAVSYGTAKIQELDNEAAKTMAQLEIDFQKENYDMITKNYEILDKQLEEKSNHIKDMFDAVTKTMKDQRDFQYNLEQDAIKNDMQARQLASSLATDALQREKLSLDIKEARDIASGNTRLLPKNIQVTVDKIAGQFDNEPIVKQYNTASQAKIFVDSLPNETTNPSDDQALIYSFAKIMDPDSVVREGEYNTVQKYSQSWVNKFGSSVNQAINGTGFLTPEARKNIKDTITSKFNVIDQQYDNVYNQYGRRIENVGAPAGTGTNYVTNYKEVFNLNNKDPMGLGLDENVTVGGSNDSLQLR